MDRIEALRLLALEQHLVPTEEEYTVGRFEPSDGAGVARLFYAVYGDGYPIDTYYIPERLAEENRLGNIRSIVARTTSGNVVAHVAFYRSSPPNRNLYEYGVGLTHPAYRSTMAFHRATELAMKQVGSSGIHGFYGEAVCNHIITQKLSKQTKALETALEPALMPGEAYKGEQGAHGRVGCMLYTRVVKDQRCRLYLPPVYQEQLGKLLDGLNLERDLCVPDVALSGSGGEIEVTRFDFAGVARCLIRESGGGLAARIEELERSLKGDGYALSQFFLDLADPASGAVVELLRAHGYSFGGLLPIWFGSDGLLMQKHFVDPDFDGLQIYSDRGRMVAEMVRRDWERILSN